MLPELPLPSGRRPGQEDRSDDVVARARAEAARALRKPPAPGDTQELPKLADTNNLNVSPDETVIVSDHATGLMASERKPRRTRLVAVISALVLLGGGGAVWWLSKNINLTGAAGLGSSSSPSVSPAVSSKVSPMTATSPSPSSIASLGAGPVVAPSQTAVSSRPSGQATGASSLPVPTATVSESQMPTSPPVSTPSPTRPVDGGNPKVANRSDGSAWQGVLVEDE